jgi:hypothetical protein
MEITTRQTIQSLINTRDAVIIAYVHIKDEKNKLENLFNTVRGHGSPLDISFSNQPYDKPESVNFDKYFWLRLTELFSLERFMLCTEYNAMVRKITDQYDFPEFTEKNIEAFLCGCKDWIKNGINAMCDRVYKDLTEGTYWVNKERKKRNNNGIDKNFILTTRDYCRIEYYYSDPTITDDLEKMCYLIDGKRLPEIGIVQQIRKNKNTNHLTGENDYFTLRVCKNGNSHYSFKNRWEKKLNALLADRTVLTAYVERIKLI